MVMSVYLSSGQNEKVEALSRIDGVVMSTTMPGISAVLGPGAKWEPVGEEESSLLFLT